VPRRSAVRTAILLTEGTRVQGLGFHGKIDLRIPVSGFQRDMPQPRSYGVNIDPGAEEMDGRGVPYRMRADVFVPQRWGRASGFGDRPLDERVHTEPRHPLSTDVEEHRAVVSTFASRTEQTAQDVDRM